MRSNPGRAVSAGSTGGLGLGGVLTVIFVVLKLLGLIKWSWLWVLSPMWISVGLGVLTGGILLLVLYIQQKRC